MAAPGEKSFCVLEYRTSESVVTVRRAFRAKNAKDPPTETRPFVCGINSLLNLGVCTSRNQVVAH